jgi:AraC-like DNA-binding protein
MDPRPARDVPTGGTWSTDAVASAEAFAYWQDLICDTFVQLSATPTTPGPFSGRIDHVTVDEVELSTVTAAGQDVRRTPRLIARSSEEYVLTSIQLAGAGLVMQDGRMATLLPGAMAFYDSTRPYTLHFDGPFRQLVVQVPRRTLPNRILDRATAVTLQPGGSGRLVADFFVGLSRLQAEDPAGARALSPHALGLLTSALGMAAGAVQSSSALARQRVLAYLDSHVADPALDVDAVADACHLSRRSLFRLFADEPEGVAGTLRRLRVDRAKVLLRAQPRRPVAAVAAACGFAGEAQLHRAFRALTGTTPAAYREVGAQRQ